MFLAGCCGSVYGQSLFTDATDNVHLPNGSNVIKVGHKYDAPDGWIGGLAAADYDNDGYIDIYVPNDKGVQDRLYRFNPVTGVYDEVGGLVGLTGETSLKVSPLQIISGKPRSRYALWIDYNGDKLLDLFVVGDNWYEPYSEILDILDPPQGFIYSADNELQRLAMHPRLYQQESDGTFTDVTVKAGFAQLRIDDLADINSARPGPLEGGDKWGFQVSPPSAGDLDADGYPEIVLGAISPAASGNVGPEFHLLVNEPSLSLGMTRLYDVSRGDSDFIRGTNFPAGAVPLVAHHQTVMADFTRSGMLDVFNARDVSLGTGQNHLWSRSQPNSLFSDISVVTNGSEVCPVDPAQNTPTYTIMPPFGGDTDMGVALGDYDNDGDIDMYIANIQNNISSPDSFQLFCNPGALTPGVGRSALYTNTGSSDISGQWEFSMREHGHSAGIVSESDGDWEWGTTFSDFNLDGFMDLAVTNGGGGSTCNDSTKFYQNMGLDPLNAAGATFQSQAWDSVPEQDVGSSLIGFDYDRDGDVDLLQSTREKGKAHSETQTCSSPNPNPRLRMRENSTDPVAGNQWITIRPRENSPNTHSIGALVTLYNQNTTTTPPTTPSRVITAGISMGGQEPYEAHFGLAVLDAEQGDMSATLMARINWLGDRPDTLIPASDLSFNAVNTVSPCSDADVAAPFGVLDVADIVWFQALFAAGDPAADINRDGDLYFDDTTAFTALFIAGCTF